MTTRIPLHALDASGATDGQVATFDDATQKWGAADAAGGGAEVLDDLTDVDLTGAADGDFLRRASGVWVPSTFAGDAVDIAYDPTASGLTATDVQAAIDELETLSGGGGGTGGDPVDDPAEWGADLGYDQEWNAGAAVPTGWAWVNQGTATATRTKGRLLIAEPTLASGNQLRLIERALPSPSVWEAVVKMRGRVWPPASTYGHFICLRDSVSGKIVAFGLNGGGASTWTVGRWNWTNASTLSAAALNTVSDAVLTWPFWKVRRNSATSWDFEVSQDGVVWNTVEAAHNVQTFLGTAPTHIGLGLWRNNVLTSAAFDWFRVR